MSKMTLDVSFFSDQLVIVDEAMGLIQHHDAISGTERQHVADDYVQRVSEGVEAAMVNNDKEKFDQVLFESPRF